MKRKKAIFFVLFGSDLGGVCVCVRVRACVLGRGGPAASLNEMVQTATNTFYNKEQEREAKAQERERRKEIRHAQMLAALQGSPMANPGSLNNKA